MDMVKRIFAIEAGDLLDSVKCKFGKCFSLRLTVHILSLIIASDSRYLSFNGGKLLNTSKLIFKESDGIEHVDCRWMERLRSY